LRTYTFILAAALLPLAACSPYQAKAVAEGFVDCRIQFETAYGTLASAAASLEAPKRLQLLVEAIEKRRKCEDLVLKQ
jgi:hypothetical protein